MLNDLDRFYLEKEEPIKSCLLALKQLILSYNPKLDHQWRYRLPCFMLSGYTFCYLWIDKKSQYPYIAIGKGNEIEHPDLVVGGRKYFGLLLINPEEDIPVEKVHEIFDQVMQLYPAEYQQ